MEQTVDFLVTSSKCSKVITPADYRKLSDLRSRIWLSGREVTERQKTLIGNLVSKYLLLLQQQGWAIQDLKTPVWSTPVRQYTPITNWTIRLDQDRGRWILKFPYHGHTVARLREVANGDCMYDAVEWDPDEFHWTIENGPQGRRLVRLLLNSNSEWQCAVADRSRLTVTEPAGPVITYLNGRWYHAHADDLVAAQLDQILAQDQPPLATVMALNNFAVTFDFRVRNYLKNWLTPVQIGILCDSDPVISQSQVPELADLIAKVNQWPVVVVQNRWDPDSQVILDFPGVVKHSHWYYEDDQKTNVMTVRDFRRLAVSKLPAVLEFPLGYPTNLELDAGVRIPWLVRCPGLMTQYSLNSDESYVRYNYVKDVVVVPDGVS